MAPLSKSCQRSSCFMSITLCHSGLSERRGIWHMLTSVRELLRYRFCQMAFCYTMMVTAEDRDSQAIIVPTGLTAVRRQRGCALILGVFHMIRCVARQIFVPQAYTACTASQRTNAIQAFSSKTGSPSHVCTVHTVEDVQSAGRC